MTTDVRHKRMGIKVKKSGSQKTLLKFEVTKGRGSTSHIETSSNFYFFNYSSTDTFLVLYTCP